MKKILSKDTIDIFKKNISENSVDILIVSAVFFISLGVFLIHVPSGFITLGILLSATAFIIYKTKGGSD
jgi:hypothetical protein